MQLPLAAGILGLSVGEIALLISGVALIFSLRRWRMVSVRSRAVRQQGLSASPGRSEPAAVERGVNPLSAAELTAELSGLLAELEETTRRVSAQMSNRRTSLELLLKEADDKIRQLESLTRGPAAVTAGRQAGKSAGAPASDAAQTLSRLRQQRGAPVPAEDPAYRPIYQLADQGKNSREIAQTLGRQPGEVELILALRARQRA